MSCYWRSRLVETNRDCAIVLAGGASAGSAVRTAPTPADERPRSSCRRTRHWAQTGFNDCAASELGRKGQDRHKLLPNRAPDAQHIRPAAPRRVHCLDVRLGLAQSGMADLRCAPRVHRQLFSQAAADVSRSARSTHSQQLLGCPLWCRCLLIAGQGRRRRMVTRPCAQGQRGSDGRRAPHVACHPRGDLRTAALYVRAHLLSLLMRALPLR
mmetsp:Transcript_48748/g.127388  ORF Transcript_48748/g.127388 Transcript_48748/m.127388 type:complete len:212 (-) Transcript_48748:911-1546(-)